MSRQVPALLPTLCTLTFFLLIFLFPITGCDAQLQFGYQIGDVYSFTDSIIESFEANQTHLYEETTHSFQIHIQNIVENASYNSIVISAKLLNLSAGLADYVQSVTMEGYTFIVASPYVYFTHTNWNLHVIDFLDSADIYQQATQMAGTIDYNLNERYFHWNMSKLVPSSISLFDTDEDGVMDSYTILSMYTAIFTVEGVIHFREFITENWFTNGAMYRRSHCISLDPDFQMPVTPLTSLLIGIVVMVMVILIGFTVFLYRRSLAK